jgi:hypothetical protein
MLECLLHFRHGLLLTQQSRTKWKTHRRSIHWGSEFVLASRFGQMIGPLAVNATGGISIGNPV